MLRPAGSLGVGQVTWSCGRGGQVGEAAPGRGNSMCEGVVARGRGAQRKLPEGHVQRVECRAVRANVS